MEQDIAADMVRIKSETTVQLSKGLRMRSLRKDCQCWKLWTSPSLLLVEGHHLHLSLIEMQSIRFRLMKKKQMPLIDSHQRTCWGAFREFELHSHTTFVSEFYF
jgi:hypothetical protein